MRSIASDLITFRWASLVIRDRRWTAPLAASALGMGLFAGVAIGPGVDGVVGAQPQQVVQVTTTPTTPTPEPTTPGPVASTPTPAPTTPPANNNPSPPPVSSPTTPTVTPPITTSPTIPETPTTTTTETTTTEEETTEDDSDDTTPTDDEEDQDAEELVLAGTVAHVNPVAGSYTLATGSSGRLSAIHAKRLPKAGTKVEVPVRQLVNGTYAEDGARTTAGKRTTVKLGGLVTFRDPDENRFTLSQLGTSILIHTDPAAAPPVAIPELGKLVTVTARISPRRETPSETAPPVDPNATTTTPTTTTPTTPTTTTTTTPTSGEANAAPAECGTAPRPPAAPKTILTATKVTVDSDLAYGDFSGIVQGVCESNRELLLSADAIDEAGEDIAFKVPQEIELGEFEPGQVVDVSAAIKAGTQALELAGLSRDKGTKEADDADLAWGDQAG